MVQCTNYQTFDGNNTIESQFGQDDITINLNYLKKNPIKDVNGYEINKNEFDDNKFNVLIPENKMYRIDEIKKYLCDVNEGLRYDDVCAIIYKNDTPINTYNAAVNNSTYGVIYNPIIYIYNNEYLSFTLLSAFSQNSYFVEASSDNSYSDFLPLIKELN